MTTLHTRYEREFSPRCARYRQLRAAGIAVLVLTVCIIMGWGLMRIATVLAR